MAKFDRQFDVCPYCKKELSGDIIFIIQSDTKGNYKLKCKDCSLTIKEVWSIDVTEYNICERDLTTDKIKEQKVFCECPDCESDNLENGDVEENGENMKRVMRCMDCGISFFEFWDFEHSFIDASEEEIISKTI